MPRFIPRERKHRRLAKQKSGQRSNDTGAIDDSNTSVILPQSKAVQEARRRALREEAYAATPRATVSGKKRQRLEKYVDTKLRKEENLELLRKVASQQIDTSLLQSSKKLSRTNETQREKLSRALRERAAGIGGDEDILFVERANVSGDEGGTDEQLENDGDDDIGPVAPSMQLMSVPNPSSFGSGLKRPLETDANGTPVIAKRKRRKRGNGHVFQPRHDAQDIGGNEASNNIVKPPLGAFLTEDDEDGESDEWCGLSSSESNADTPSNGTSETSRITDEDESNSLYSDGSLEEEKSHRVSAFKQWADTQRNASIDFTPSLAPTHDSTVVDATSIFKPREPSPDPVLSSIQHSVEGCSRPTEAMAIIRLPEIQVMRMELPVVQEEQKIMEAVNSNPVIILCGATGSGKTTQVPQMLFENGYGSRVGKPMSTASGKDSLQSRGIIGITQPRRVAATSVAGRVADELGPEHRHQVAHQVRYDSSVSKDTAIKFMTDGILLREIQQDFPLSKYSCIVIDEAHERSVNTDILIGMLSRIVDLRATLAKEEPEKWCPLKLVIMSATLQTATFLENTRLFRHGKPPVVEAEGRQFPVTIHFSKRTRRDYVDEIVEKVARGHRKLPAGSILVFLTGQQEIHDVARKLREKLGMNATSRANDAQKPHINQMLPEDGDHEDRLVATDKATFLEGVDDDSDQESDIQTDGIDDMTDDEFIVEEGEGPRRPLSSLQPHIVTLYAALPAAQQLKVFQPPPDGTRHIILATNVAETSLTIPGVRYVFDSGRSKEKRYGSSTGIQTFEIDWISQASASQRMGRAGRTGPGHCYRLYSSAVYEHHFAEHTTPEILRTPLESVVLQLKALDIQNVANFPFPTNPGEERLEVAEKLLANIGALDDTGGRLTEVGREILQYPVAPRFGKILALARKNNMVNLAVAVVAALAVGDLFIHEAQSETLAESGRISSGGIAIQDSDGRPSGTTGEEAESGTNNERIRAYKRAQSMLSRWDHYSDAIKILTATAAHAEAQAKSAKNAASICVDFFLKEKNMAELQRLRAQLHFLATAGQPASSNSGSLFKLALQLPSEKERSMLNQIIAAGFVDQVAIRADLFRAHSMLHGRKPRRAIETPYLTLFPTASARNIDHTLTPAEQEAQHHVFIHSSSVLAHLSVSEMPQYVVYSHLSRAAPSQDGANIKRTRMHPLTTIGPKALAVLAEGTPMLQILKPVGKIEEVAAGDDGRPRRECWVSVALAPPNGVGVEWPLTAWKVLQRKSKSGSWVVVKILSR